MDRRSSSVQFSTPQTSHRRKISHAELMATYRNAGPMVAPPPHPSQQPQMTAAQTQAQQLEAARRGDMARRQSRKPTDRDISEDVSEVVVGDGVTRYKRLRDVEKKLDAVMMRKRLDVKDNAQREYARREGVLRIWVSNTAEGQPWQVMEDGSGMGEDAIFDLGENSQATFRVKIEGRLLEDPTELEEDKPSPDKRPRLSTFFKGITIDLHRNPALMPDGYSQIEWRKQQQPTPQNPNPNYDPNSSENSFDKLEFERKGDENVNVTISLMRDTERERYKLSSGLAEILDSEEEDMLGAVQGIWEYARAMNLQEDDDKRTIVCDEPLRKVSNARAGNTEDSQLTHPSSLTRRNCPSHTFLISSNLICALSLQSSSITRFASTRPTSHHQPMAKQKPPHPPSTTYASLFPTLRHTSHTDTQLRSRTSQTCSQLSAPTTTWLCLSKNSTRQMPNASSTRTWPKTPLASSNDGAPHSNATWKSSLRKPLGVVEAVASVKKAQAKSGGRVARAAYGAARWREKVLACGLRGRARRIRTLIPRQRDLLAFAALTAISRSARDLHSLLARPTMHTCFQRKPMER
jgi:chromatin remodeling complex protein RSC6